MKKILPLIPVLLLIALTVNRCTNPMASDTAKDVLNSADDGLSAEDRYQQIENLDAGLEDLTQITADDSTEFVRRRLHRAMEDLGAMLRHVGWLVAESSNDSAQTVFDEAIAARDSAIAAIQADSIRLAFEYIRESRDYAREAYKIVKGEEMPTPEEVFEKLVQAMHDLDDLLLEVRGMLDGTDIPGRHRLFQRALNHRRMAGIALHDRHLRKAGHHIRESFRYANAVKRIIEEFGQTT